MAQVDARNDSAACTSTFDLTTTFMKYLDPQLSLLMIDFISEKNVCHTLSSSPPVFHSKRPVKTLLITTPNVAMS